ncbi:MAG: transposase [Myxococcaceae bacterium]|nr:transposase [Myxococcaceae bacterium]
MLIVINSSYETRLSDRYDRKQWAVVLKLFQELHLHGGRPCKHSRRSMLDAIFYITRTGCQWRLLPHDSPWDSVYENFRRWEKVGFLKKLHDTLRLMLTRFEHL